MWGLLQSEFVIQITLIGLSRKLYFFFFNANWLKKIGQILKGMKSVRKKSEKVRHPNRNRKHRDLPADSFFLYFILKRHTYNGILVQKLWCFLPTEEWLLRTGRNLTVLQMLELYFCGGGNCHTVPSAHSGCGNFACCSIFKAPSSSLIFHCLLG